MAKKYRVVDLEIAARLRAEGKTYAQIARRWKVTASAVQDLLRRHGRVEVKPHRCSRCLRAGVATTTHRADRCLRAP